MVLRRAVPHRLPGAAPAAGARLPGAGPPGLARHRRLRPPRTTGHASGPRPTCSSRRGRSGPGSRSRASGSSRSSAGPSAAGTPPPATATPCRASTSSGAPAPASSSRSPGGSAPRSTPAWSSCASGTGSPSWSSPTARSPVSAARSWSPAASPAARPARAPRSADFEITAQAVVVTAGGIGGNHDLVRKNWPARLGPAPQRMLSGVPAYVDGHMLEATEAAGASVVNRDRMWHYTEGIANHSPVWAKHGIRILPGPSSMWFDATGKRLPVPLFPGFDTLGTLAHIGTTGYEHTWFVATHKIVEKEFALSGSEQNPDLTGKDVRLLATRVKAGVAAPVQAFLDRGEDFVVAAHAARAGRRDEPDHRRARRSSTSRTLEREIVARDREIAHPFTKDLQITAIRGARNYLGDKLIRVAPPHRILDPDAGPLVAVRLNLLTRKTLGGLETDLSGRVLRPGRRGLPRPVRGRRDRRLRRRRHARLPVAGGHLPRRLPLLGPRGGPRGGGRAVSGADGRSRDRAEPLGRPGHPDRTRPALRRPAGDRAPGPVAVRPGPATASRTASPPRRTGRTRPVAYGPGAVDARRRRRGPAGPGQVVGSAVLAFVQAALVLFASLYVWFAVSLIGFAAGQAPGSSSRTRRPSPPRARSWPRARPAVRRPARRRRDRGADQPRSRTAWLLAGRGARGPGRARRLLGGPPVHAWSATSRADGQRGRLRAPSRSSSPSPRSSGSAWWCSAPAAAGSTAPRGPDRGARHTGGMSAALRTRPRGRHAAPPRPRRAGRRRRAAARHRRGADARLDGRRGAAPHPHHRPRDVLVAQPRRVLGEGRDLGAPPVGARGAAGLRRRRAARAGRPGGPGLPHGRAQLLPPAAAGGAPRRGRASQ